MTVAGRRSRDRPGPDGAPRSNPLDVRWGSAYQFIVTTYPESRDYLWELLSEVFNQGQRAGDGAPDPFWLDRPEVAGAYNGVVVGSVPANSIGSMKETPVNDALAVMPPKVRAWIYLILIVANAVVVPLMAAGVIPSLYGTIILGLMGVFGGATALANVQKAPVAAVVAYDARHDDEEK